MIEKTLQTLSSDEHTLYIAFDLGKKKWSIALTDRTSRKPSCTSIEAFDTFGLKAAIDKARKRFGLEDECLVVSCQEAGRDGFAVHRYLVWSRWLSTRRASRPIAGSAGPRPIVWTLASW